MIVADTNLIVYLYVQGQYTNRSEAVLRRDAAWVMPLLWRSELRNALVGLVRRRDLEAHSALQIANEAERQMAGSEYSVPSAAVLELALLSGCTAYNCEFVALARDLNIQLITADRQVLAAFPGIAVSPEAFVA